MAQRSADSARGPSPARSGVSFDGRQQATAGSQHLAATPVEVKSQPFLPFFFLILVPRMETSAELCSNAVELADTHAHSKSLLEQFLDDGTWCVNSLSTECFEKCSYLATQFRRMPMSPVLQSDFSLGTDGTKQAVGHGSLQWYTYSCAHLRPGLAFKQRCDQLLSGSLAFCLHVMLSLPITPYQTDHGLIFMVSLSPVSLVMA